MEGVRGEMEEEKKITSSSPKTAVTRIPTASFIGKASRSSRREEGRVSEVPLAKALRSRSERGDGAGGIRDQVRREGGERTSFEGGAEGEGEKRALVVMVRGRERREEGRGERLEG